MSVNAEPVVLNGKKFPGFLKLKLFRLDLKLHCKTQLQEAEMFHFTPEFIFQVVFDVKLPEVWGLFLFACFLVFK